MPAQLLKHRFLLISLLGVMIGTSIPCHADCKVSYNQSVALLESHLQKTQATQNAATANADAFEVEFRSSVAKLQEEKCLPELMSLIQRIQSEQQKHTRPDKKAMPTPIVD